MMTRFVIELDDFTETLFYELERITDGHESHKCEIDAETKQDAFVEIMCRIEQHFLENMEEKGGD